MTMPTYPNQPPINPKLEALTILADLRFYKKHLKRIHMGIRKVVDLN